MIPARLRGPHGAFEHDGAESSLLASLGVAKVGVWILDADGRTTFANEPLADMLGTTREATLGRRAGELLDGEESRAATTLLDGASDEHPDQHELRLPRGSGR